MRTFEYGVVHLTFDPSLQPYPYVFNWQFGLDGELSDIPWFLSPDDGGGARRSQLVNPGLVPMYLGRRGWEPFQVTWLGGPPTPSIEYHFRRSSADRQPATAV